MSLFRYGKSIGLVSLHAIASVILSSIIFEKLRQQEMPLLTGKVSQDISARINNMSGIETFYSLTLLPFAFYLVTRAYIAPQIGSLPNPFTKTPKREKERIAYHEAGHVVGCTSSKHVDFEYATIIPNHDGAAGHVKYKADDGYLSSKDWFFDLMVMGYMGQLAEKKKFGLTQFSAGAVRDIEQNTQHAIEMVTRFGMGDDLPPLMYSQCNMDGSGIAYEFSEATKQKVDTAIMKMASDAYKRAQELIDQKWDDVETVAQLLLKHGTRSSAQIRAALQTSPAAPEPNKI